ncbi:hypothetical protein KO481_05635 [Nocardia sp. NEAU-G5]|uniref:Uncharacterized protein n=1 Tax=Nocardia albiluteola TaxID=2842303 RepID=A0ABS6ATU8_9NOCA|nr:hypothetical protein [Nocardia albiluteola]MBU3061005.1 hypothetical protein [Nocardia albiluteola]
MNPVGGTTLEAREVLYYSYNDEAAFFGWLDKIPCVKSYVGRGNTLYMEVDPAAVDDENFADLFALFRRYGVDREQLRPLDTGNFSSWFAGS